MPRGDNGRDHSRVDVPRGDNLLDRPAGAGA